MGVIQQAISGTVSTALGAAVAGKHLKQQQQQAETAERHRELTSVYNYNVAKEKFDQTQTEMKSITSEIEEKEAEFATKEAQQKEADEFLYKWNAKHPSGQLAFSRFGSGESIVKSRKSLEAERGRWNIQKQSLKDRFKDAEKREALEELDLKYAEAQLPEKYTGGIKEVKDNG